MHPPPSASVHTGTHDQHAIKQLNGELLPHGIGIRQWRITSCKRPIIGDKEVERYQAELGNVLSVPEILFGNSHLTLHHVPSGVALSFLALDALKAWRQEDLPPLKVTVASAWQKAREKEIQAQNALILEYDWTYTTPYAGTVVQGWQAGAEDAAAAPAAATARGELQWEGTSEQIDRALLMQREPILYYDEVPLYESELDDNGTCQLVAKVRVMPRCWFVLLRLWLKVDGCMARLRETRFFCKLGADGEGGPTTAPAPAPAEAGGEAAAAAEGGRGQCYVLREERWCEGSFEELRAAGAPPDGPSYADADSAAAVFGAIAPIGLKKYELSKLVLQRRGS